MTTLLEYATFAISVSLYTISTYLHLFIFAPGAIKSPFKTHFLQLMQKAQVAHPNVKQMLPVKNIKRPPSLRLTSVTVVVYQDDLSDQVVGCAVGDAVDGSEQGGPAFVVEGDDNAGVRELFEIKLLLTAGREKKEWDRKSQANPTNPITHYTKCFTRASTYNPHIVRHSLSPFRTIKVKHKACRLLR